MNFFDKLSYGGYWFAVCAEEWYDTVMLGYYDEDEQLWAIQLESGTHNMTWWGDDEVTIMN